MICSIHEKLAIGADMFVRESIRSRYAQRQMPKNIGEYIGFYVLQIDPLCSKKTKIQTSQANKRIHSTCLEPHTSLTLKSFEPDWLIVVGTIAPVQITVATCRSEKAKRNGVGWKI